jgi:hypothetical protein
MVERAVARIREAVPGASVKGVDVVDENVDLQDGTAESKSPRPAPFPYATHV